MGMARKTVRMLLNNTPSFIRAARLEMPLSHSSRFSLSRLHQCRRTRLARELRSLAGKPGYDAVNVLGRHGSGLDVTAPVRQCPTPGGLQSQPFEVVGRLLMRGMNHPQSEPGFALSPAVSSRDRRSSRSGYASAPRFGSPGACAVKGGGVGLGRASGFCQDRIPWTIASICLSVSIPLHSVQKAGISNT